MRSALGADKLSRRLEAEAVSAKLRDELLRAAEASNAPVLGITGTGGAGKSFARGAASST